MDIDWRCGIRFDSSGAEFYLSVRKSCFLARLFVDVSYCLASFRTTKQILQKLLKPSRNNFVSLETLDHRVTYSMLK